MIPSGSRPGPPVKNKPRPRASCSPCCCLENDSRAMCAFGFCLGIILVIFVAAMVINPGVYNNNDQIDVVYTWVNGSDPRFLANLKVISAFLDKGSIDLSPQRYDDKLELKYSLRSLEVYAPWIRKVHIVTNGQIPNWISLFNPKLNIVQHKDIFENLEHLPTFSSPAIEFHLHKIRDITKRFIYFNDDTFLGKPVYYEDFHTVQKGYSIYLSWPIPPCAEDCPWMYVNDGQCDSQCYNPSCQMDGNDCVNAEKDEQGRLVQSKYDKYDVMETAVDGTTETIPKNILTSLNSSTHDIPRLVNNLNVGIVKSNRIKRRLRSAKSHSRKKRVKTVDAYGESLQYSNKVLNKRYGYKTRHVAAHAPILIDVPIMIAMSKAFKKEIYKTSSSRFRSPDDLQFAFTYYHYLMEETLQVSVGEIFDKFDTDKSKTWSDREIRTIMTKIYDLPLSYGTVEHFEWILSNCTNGDEEQNIPVPVDDRYSDSKLSVITRDMVLKCHLLGKLLKKQFGRKPKYNFEVINNAHFGDVTFKMLSSNVSDVAGQLDEIRRKPTKFVCLNDNLDASRVDDNEFVKTVLHDFYQSILPIPSESELSDYRNRFQYLDDFNNWRFERIAMRATVLGVFLSLCFYAIYLKMQQSNIGIVNVI
ncbi:PREDICTED: N-acetylglucosamine-1-phosphotransferase subunits alpha/beta [Nicrophorus vespilloides]|uniref:N-acetylglucosamine-1-phosphotransferase subunits alpha/beta n=1 Tax=Nicrophorus vespilloides TaxID=110193 RepID=A0ABM1MIQ4_NICVS|nr:PREDICTED: N-acetylglucosamine-1-phosphotransferase subunits alpha/beta [Nicrophorus vespilloides]